MWLAINSWHVVNTWLMTLNWYVTESARDSLSANGNHAPSWRCSSRAYVTSNLLGKRDDKSHGHMWRWTAWRATWTMQWNDGRHPSLSRATQYTTRLRYNSIFRGVAQNTRWLPQLDVPMVRGAMLRWCTVRWCSVRWCVLHERDLAWFQLHN